MLTLFNLTLFKINFGPSVTGIGQLGGGASQPHHSQVHELSVPWQPIRPDSDSFSILSWRSRSSRFSGRMTEIQKLEKWAASDYPVQVKFVVGEGGTGKSRLGGEFAERMKDNGWAAGFLNLKKSVPFTMKRNGTLIVIDYPEENIQETIEILQDLANLGNDHRIRVLFLTRQRPEQWANIISKANARLIVDNEFLTLSQLDSKAAKTVFDTTVNAAGKHFGKTDEDGFGPGAISLDAITEWLTKHDVNGRALFVMAAAVKAAEDPDNKLVDFDSGEVVKALVDREIDRLIRIATGIRLDDDYLLAYLSVLAAICNDLDQEKLISFINENNFPGFEPGSGLRKILKSSGMLREGQIPAPVPDIIAAAFCVEVFSRKPEVASDIMGAAIGFNAESAIARLNRICWDAQIVLGIQQPRLGDILAKSIEDQPNLARSLSTIFTAVTIGGMLSIAKVATYQIELRKSDSPEEESVWLNNLAIEFSLLKRHERALEAIRGSIEIGRRMAQGNLPVYENKLAGSLVNLSNCLAILGQDKEALIAIKESVDIYRRLPKDNLQIYEPDLALCLNNLSNRLSNIGERDEALASIQESVEIYRRLARGNPSVFEPGLAMSVNNLSNKLYDLGMRKEALVAIKDAVKIRRRLTNDNPQIYELYLEDSLHDHSIILNDLGKTEEAQKVIQEAEEIRSRYPSEAD